MLGQHRRMNDLDNFLSQGRPHKQETNTHSPTRLPAHYQSTRNIINVSSVQRSPSRQHLPLCSNTDHKKKAQFTGVFDGEQLFFCEKCAASAASNGFPVVRIDGNPIKPKKELMHKRTIPSYPALKQSAIYQEIIATIKQINTVENNSIETLTKINQHSFHQQNVINVEQFYGQILARIEILRDNHINSVIKQNQAIMKMGPKLKFSIEEGIANLIEMREDLEKNLQTIVANISQKQFNQCIKQYKRTINGIIQCLQRSDNSIKQEQLKSGAVNRIMNEIEKHIKGAWQKQLQQQKTQKSYNQIHDMLPKMQNQGKSAFRLLFDEQDLPLPQASPQFKMI